LSEKLDCRNPRLLFRDVSIVDVGQQSQEAEVESTAFGLQISG
jgi:hypothetical protein